MRAVQLYTALGLHKAGKPAALQTRELLDSPQNHLPSPRLAAASRHPVASAALYAAIMSSNQENSNFSSNKDTLSMQMRSSVVDPDANERAASANPMCLWCCSARSGKS